MNNCWAFFPGNSHCENLTGAKPRLNEPMAPGGRTNISPGLTSRFVENVRGNSSGDKLAVIQVAEELSVFHHHLAFQKSSHRPSANVPAFPDAVVTQVQIDQGQGFLNAGVDEHDVVTQYPLQAAIYLPTLGV